MLVDDQARPAGPGEEPAFARNMPEHIKQLGSPLVSRLVPLPMKDRTGRLRFGMNVKELLAKISGENQPGAYLLGYREIGGSTKRRFARIQVTDLSLSTVEAESAVNFVVTSLKTGDPVPGAKIVVEGKYRRDNEATWRPILSGVTDHVGQYRYEHTARIRAQARRIVVSHGDDVLVLNPEVPPPHFLDNHWYGSHPPWLPGCKTTLVKSKKGRCGSFISSPSDPSIGRKNRFTSRGICVFGKKGFSNMRARAEEAW